MFSKEGRFAYRDRPLKKGEKYHWYCIRCGKDVHPDMMLQHRCSPLKFNNKAKLNIPARRGYLSSSMIG